MVIKNLKVGIFHWNTSLGGGGEYLVHYLAKALGARVYTIVEGKNKYGFYDISYLLPPFLKKIRLLPSLDYLCWSNIDVLDIDDFDIVITSGATARALIVPEEIMHVHYLHSPPRWLWDLWHWRRKKKSRIAQTLITPLAEFFRIWDRAVDANVDYYFVNSPIIKQRLWKYYKRDGVVLYPPVECNKYKFKEYGDFYLHIGRFDPEKRIRIAVDACLKAKRKLILVGIEGRDKDTFKYVKKLSETSPYIEYLGYVSDKEKRKLLSECKAVIYPPVAEDFGIVPIEAIASGKPVIVANSGFPKILVEQKKCGVIAKPTVDEMFKAILELERNEWYPEEIQEKAREFDYETFKSRLNFWLVEWYNEFLTKINPKMY